jgi:hypothetical protein
MAGETFKVDDRDLRELRDFYRRAPAVFRTVAADLINDFAFGSRNASFEVLREKMVIRNFGFMQRQIRVAKARQNAPIDTQKAEVGSVPTRRFSGWKEQQTGERTARERVVNLLARGGNKKRQVRRPARLRPGSDFESYRKYPGRGVEQRNIVMLQRLDSQRWKRPFLVLGKRGMRPGLYKFVRRKPKLLQLFDPKSAQPRKIPWLTDAVARYFQREDIGRLWARKMRYRLKSKGKS